MTLISWFLGPNILGGMSTKRQRIGPKFETSSITRTVPVIEYVCNHFMCHKKKKCLLSVTSVNNNINDASVLVSETARQSSVAVIYHEQYKEPEPGAFGSNSIFILLFITLLFIL